MRIEGWGFACPAVVGFLALPCWGLVLLLVFWPFLDLLVVY
jgi:hypothetical protein